MRIITNMKHKVNEATYSTVNRVFLFKVEPRFLAMERLSENIETEIGTVGCKNPLSVVN